MNARLWCVIVAAVVGAPGVAADESPFSHAPLVSPESEQAVARGLAFLAERQLDDGSFGSTGNGRNVAVVGLSGMAFLAQGSAPGRGAYAEQIDRCIDFLLANSADSGLVAAPQGAARGPMYGHGFATLFLCEVHGMTDRPDLRDAAARAIELIVAAQNREGGWRYEPRPQDADVSVTVCQVMALRAARNAGFAVPRETIDRSTAYVKKCQNDDGGFRYMLTQGPPDSGFARSAGGVVALYNAGVYEGPEIEAGLAYLGKHITDQGIVETETYYFYGHYYAAQAMWHAGGDKWQRWFPAIRDQLIARQREDGSWIDPVSAEYATAMACIVLQTPNNFLPILQR